MSPKQRPSPEPDSGSITGHDGFVIAKALAYAIIAIERLPEPWQDRSDLGDMVVLLHAFADDLADTFLARARSHLEQRRLELAPGGDVVAGERTQWDADNVVQGVFEREQEARRLVELVKAMDAERKPGD